MIEKITILFAVVGAVAHTIINLPLETIGDTCPLSTIKSNLLVYCVVYRQARRWTYTNVCLGTKINISIWTAKCLRRKKTWRLWTLRFAIWNKCLQLITLTCVGELPVNVKLSAVLPKLMFNRFFYLCRVSLNDDSAKAFVTWIMIDYDHDHLGRVEWISLLTIMMIITLFISSVINEFIRRLT